MSKIRKSVISLIFVAALFFGTALLSAKTEVRAEVSPASVSELKENTFVMEKGASIRADYQDGLRYSAALPKSAYESLVAKYGEDKISFGTFILPNYYVVNYGAPNAENCFGENPTYVWNTESCAENQHIVLHNTTKTVTPLGENYVADGYVIGMKNATRKNLNVLYSGYIYLKADNADGTSEYLFASQNDNERSMLLVACKALEAPENAEYNELLTAYLTAYKEYRASVGGTANFKYTVKTVKGGVETSSVQGEDELFAIIDKSEDFGEEEGYVLDKAASNLVGRVYPDNSLAITAVYKSKTVLPNPDGKNDFFAFGKDSELTADYAAANTENGYYTADVSAVTDKITSVTVCGEEIKDFVREGNALKISVSEISAIDCKEGFIHIFTEDKCYEGNIVIADYVITTAEEFKTVLPYAEQNSLNKLFVFGNDISGIGDYTNAATGGWFNGTLDGRGYAISDMNITEKSLFTNVSPYAVIKNLAVLNVTGASAVIAQTFYGTIKDVYVHGALTGAPSALVAVSGAGYENGNLIENVLINVTATGAWVNDGVFRFVAGAAAKCNATVTNCYAVSDIATGLYSDAAWGAAVGTDKVYASESAFLDKAEVLTANFNGRYWKLNGSLYFGNNAVIKAAEKMQPISGKHEIFSFAKETDKTADYAANNIENGYYKILLPVSVGSITELKIKGAVISDYSYTDAEKTLKIAVSEIANLATGEGDMSIKTPVKDYGAKIVVADCVITTAVELKAVLPYAEQNSLNKLFVLGNDISGIGDYTNAATGGWFNGTLDGRGYAISDMNITEKSLFINVSPYAVIKNLAVLNVTGASAVIAQTFYGTIKDVYVHGALNGAPSALVAVAADSVANLGYAHDEIIENVIVNVTATGAWVNDGAFRFVSGAAAKCYATVTNCYAISGINTGLYSDAAWGAPVGTDKVYGGNEAFLENAEGLLENFGEFWSVAEGKIYFGNQLIIG